MNIRHPYLFSNTCMLLFCFSALYSCKCEDKQCSGFLNDYWQWVGGAKMGDQVMYQNSAGGVKKFIFAGKEQTQPYISHSRSNEFGGCFTEDCEADGSVVAYAQDSSYIRYGFQTSVYRKDSQVLSALVCRIGDFNCRVGIEPLRPEDNKSFAISGRMEPHLQLGARVYDNVLVQTRIPDSAKHYEIRTVYIAKGYGIIGFEDSLSVYYLP